MCFPQIHFFKHKIRKKSPIFDIIKLVKLKITKQKYGGVFL